jgi:transposase
MGKAARSTILELDLSPRACGGANTEKRAALEKTTAILKGGSKSRRMNRRQTNQLRGKIRQYAGEKAYARCSVVTVEINPHGTSQYCCRCGAKGKRFFFQSGKRIFVKWGNLFWCETCHYEANADHNASVNTHHSFYHELHWEWRDKKRAKPASPG